MPFHVRGKVVRLSAVLVLLALVPVSFAARSGESVDMAKALLESIDDTGAQTNFPVKHPLLQPPRNEAAAEPDTSGGAAGLRRFPPPPADEPLSRRARPEIDSGGSAFARANRTFSMPPLSSATRSPHGVPPGRFSPNDFGRVFMENTPFGGFAPGGLLPDKRLTDFLFGGGNGTDPGAGGAGFRSDDESAIRRSAHPPFGGSAPDPASAGQTAFPEGLPRTLREGTGNGAGGNAFRPSFTDEARVRQSGGGTNNEESAAGEVLPEAADRFDAFSAAPQSGEGGMPGRSPSRSPADDPRGGFRGRDQLSEQPPFGTGASRTGIDAAPDIGGFRFRDVPPQELPKSFPGFGQTLSFADGNRYGMERLDDSGTPENPDPSIDVARSTRDRRAVDGSGGGGRRPGHPEYSGSSFSDGKAQAAAPDFRGRFPFLGRSTEQRGESVAGPPGRDAASADKPPAPARSDGRPRSASERRDGQVREGRNADEKSADSMGWTTFALWAAGVLAICLLALILKDKLGGKRRAGRKKRTEPGEGGLPEEVGVQMLMTADQGEIDRLAARGRFAEAIHLMLLRSLYELDERMRAGISFSRTSREVLSDVQLDSRARSAFADIVGRAEASHFGMRPPSERDFLACRESFVELEARLPDKRGRQ